MKTALSIKKTIPAFFLFLLFFVPPLFFVPGFFNGQCIFVSYREPKLAALQILSWLFISAFTIFLYADFKKTIYLALKDRLFWLLLTFTCYSLVSASWALVPLASLYEAAQWGTLTVLFLVLYAIFSDPKWKNLAIWSLWLSFGVVTVLGLTQTFIYIPWLMPMVQEFYYTSTFGAKNTCFVSLASQYFILFYGVYLGVFEQRKKCLIIAAILVLLETVYLFISQSRTTYAGATLGIILLTALYCRQQIKERKWMNILTPFLFIALTVICIYVFLAFQARTSRVDRFEAAKKIENLWDNKIKDFIIHPSSFFLKTTRGASMLDTLDMVRDHPFGVGDGNWGFMYPLYHKRMPAKDFSSDIQIRRAHNTYIETLGNLGYPGLFILLAILFITLKRLISYQISAIKKENFFRHVMIIQLLSIMVMMFFTFYLEYPYRKFLFIMILALSANPKSFQDSSFEA